MNDDRDFLSPEDSDRRAVDFQDLGRRAGAALRRPASDRAVDDIIRRARRQRQTRSAAVVAVVIAVSAGGFAVVRSTRQAGVPTDTQPPLVSSSPETTAPTATTTSIPRTAATTVAPVATEDGSSPDPSTVTAALLPEWPFGPGWLISERTEPAEPRADQARRFDACEPFVDEVFALTPPRAVAQSRTFTNRDGDVAANAVIVFADESSAKEWMATFRSAQFDECFLAYTPDPPLRPGMQLRATRGELVLEQSGDELVARDAMSGSGDDVRSVAVVAVRVGRGISIVDVSYPGMDEPIDAIAGDAAELLRVSLAREATASDSTLPPFTEPQRSVQGEPMTSPIPSGASVQFTPDGGTIVGISGRDVILLDVSSDDSRRIGVGGPEQGPILVNSLATHAFDGQTMWDLATGEPRWAFPSELSPESGFGFYGASAISPA